MNGWGRKGPTTTAPLRFCTSVNLLFSCVSFFPPIIFFEYVVAVFLFALFLFFFCTAGHAASYVEYTHTQQWISSRIFSLILVLNYFHICGWSSPMILFVVVLRPPRAAAAAAVPSSPPPSARTRLLSSTLSSSWSSSPKSGKIGQSDSCCSCCCCCCCWWW